MNDNHSNHPNKQSPNTNHIAAMDIHTLQQEMQQAIDTWEHLYQQYEQYEQYEQQPKTTTAQINTPKTVYAMHYLVIIMALGLIAYLLWAIMHSVGFIF